MTEHQAGARRQRRIVAAVVAATMVALAVSGGVTCGGSSANRTRGEAALIVGYPEGLFSLSVDGSSHRDMVVPAEQDRVPRAPAVSPDGHRIAYLLGPQPGATTDDTGTDVWLADRDGSHRRPLLRHPMANRWYRAVTWEDAAHVLVVVDVPADCDGCNPETTTAQILARVDVETSSLAAVRSGVTDVALSPNGQSIVFPLQGNDRAEGLQTGALDGSTPTVLVPLASGFAQIGAARYSPDGRTIAFCAAQPRSLRADARLVSMPLAPRAFSPTRDILPQDVWLIDSDGQRLRLVAGLRALYPSIAWDPDGRHIHAISAAGLYSIDVGSGAVARMGAGAVGGTLEYSPPVK